MGIVEADTILQAAVYMCHKAGAGNKVATSLKTAFSLGVAQWKQVWGCILQTTCTLGLCPWGCSLQTTCTTPACQARAVEILKQLAVERSAHKASHDLQGAGLRSMPGSGLGCKQGACKEMLVRG